MYFRALGSVLFRRLSPRGIPRAASVPSPAIFSRADLRATVPRHARPHHIRDLAVDGSYGAVSVAAFALFAGSLYLLKKDTVAEDSRMEVTAQETSREMPQVFKDESMNDAAIRAMFTNKDGKVNWGDYIDYLTFGKTFPQNKATYQYEEVDDMETREQEGHTVDEAAMKARFEQWMKEYDKVYGSEEETAMRYERFKRSARLVDKYNASKQGSIVFGLNHLSDYTEEERQSMRPPPHDDQYWEWYVEHLKTVRTLSKDDQRSVPGSLILKLQGRDASHHEGEGLMEKNARREEIFRRHQEVASATPSSASGTPSSEKTTEPHELI